MRLLYATKQLFFLLIMSMMVCVTSFANPDIQYFQKKQIVQRIIWDDENDVLQYDIIIEKQSGEKFSPYLTEIAKEPYVDVNLEPGSYRYNIIAYDLLGRKQDSDEWANLKVLPALQPEIETINPDVFYLDEEHSLLHITISGNNLTEESKFFLRSASGSEIEIEEHSIDDLGLGAKISVEKRSIQKGVWSVYAQNPGGLEAHLSISILENKATKVFYPERKFTTSQGYAPLLQTGGKFLGYFDSLWNPAGIAIRFSYLPITRTFGSIGFEFEPTWSYLIDNDLPSYPDNQVSAQLIGLQLFSVYQKGFVRNHFLLNARFGTGVFFLANLQLQNKIAENYSFTNDVNGWTMSIIGGLSVKFFVLPTFFLETGAEYLFMFTADNPSFLRPMLFIGWTF